MNRQKPQLVKGEKENEIKRKKSATVGKDKSAKTETVWDRLSKVHKVDRNENRSATLPKSKTTTIRTKSSNRVSQLHRGIGNSTGGSRPSAIQSNISSQNKKPLTSNNSSNKRLQQEVEKKAARRVKSAKISYGNVVVEEVPLFLPVTSVKEILTARSMYNSQSSSGNSKKSPTGVPTSKRASSCQTDSHLKFHPNSVRSYTGHSRHSYSHMNSHINSHTVHCENDRPTSHITSIYSKGPIAVKSAPAQSHIKIVTDAISKKSDPKIHMHTDSDSHFPSSTSSQQCSNSHFVTAPTSHVIIPTKCDASTSARSCTKTHKITHANNVEEDPNSPVIIPTKADASTSPRSCTKTPKIIHGNIEEEPKWNELIKNSQQPPGTYQAPPVLQAPTRKSLSPSSKMERSIKGLMKKKEQQRMMTHSELKLIKRVIRSDERYRQLHQIDEKLCKDILKTQLNGIMKQGMIVKSALRRLDTTDSEMELSSNTNIEKPQVNPEPAAADKQQIDVVFKNVPTLEKEIFILRALGEKLEATLNRTASRRNLHVSQNKAAASSMMQVMHYNSSSFVVGVLHYARVHVLSMGIRRCSGFAQEFHIEHKTIVELKKESDRHFYLPLDSDQSNLRCTNFKKLKQHPDVLMRYLRPKNTMVPFNVLDQDPIFFNSFIFNMVSVPPTAPRSPKIKQVLNTENNQDKLALHEGGDSTKNSCPSLPRCSEGVCSGGISVGISNDTKAANGSDNDGATRCGNESANGSGNDGGTRCGNEDANGSGNDGGNICGNEGGNGSGIENGNGTGNGGGNGSGNEDDHGIGNEVVNGTGSEGGNRSVNVNACEYDCNRNEGVAAEFHDGCSKENVESNTLLKTHVTFSDVLSNKENKVIDDLPIEERISIVRAQQSRRIRRSVTPMPLNKYPEPKNNLVKTILVGSLQISVFLLLIMAITFPELKC